MASYLPSELKAHADPSISALARGEYVHVHFVGSLVEAIQISLQGYKKARVPGAPRGPGTGRVSRNKHAQRQVVVQDGGQFQAESKRNALKNAATRIANRIALQDFA
jgi:hypothetical protein